MVSIGQIFSNLMLFQAHRGGRWDMRECMRYTPKIYGTCCVLPRVYPQSYFQRLSRGLLFRVCLRIYRTFKSVIVARIVFDTAKSTRRTFSFKSYLSRNTKSTLTLWNLQKINLSHSPCPILARTSVDKRAINFNPPTTLRCPFAIVSSHARVPELIPNGQNPKHATAHRFLSSPC